MKSQDQSMNRRTFLNASAAAAVPLFAAPFLRASQGKSSAGTVKLAIIGESIAHEYIYTSLLQGHPDDSIFQKNATAWQAKLLNDNKGWKPVTDRVKVTYIYSELEETAKKTSETYKLTVCDSLADAVRLADGALVLDKSESVPLHRKHAEAFLNAGKPVWVEKPFTWSVEDARALAALSKKKNVPLQSFSSMRFAPELDVLKPLIPKVGQLINITSWGPGELIDYYNHTLGPLQELAQPGWTAVTWAGNADYNYMIFDHVKGYYLIAQIGKGNKYQWQAYGTAGTEIQRSMDNYPCFRNGAQHIADMFISGKVRVPVDYSVELVVASNAAQKAKKEGRKVAFSEFA